MTELALPCSARDLGLATLKTPQIVYKQDAEDVALAGMLVDIIKSNIKNSEAKAIAFMTLKTSVYLSITDADVDLTLTFDKGDLSVSGGKDGEPNISIITDSTTLMDLSNLKTTALGLPNFFEEPGKSILKKFLNGELRIKGLLLYLFSLIKLTKVLSVA